ncbi:MAG TPA: efflux RND transporter periplasmic adaptor subunit [Kofleriaceae bacterium]|jgi:multidrug efflux system membrane fusion protein
MPVDEDDNASAAIEPPPKRRRKRRFVIWAVVLAAFVGVFWWALHTGSTKAASTRARAGVGMAITVETVTATRTDLPIRIDAIGTVTPIYTDAITSQVSGIVEKVTYKEGQLVTRGTPLVEIDPRPLAAMLMQAQGTLERDQHVLEQARMDLERYRAAWDKKAIAKQQLDDQEKIAEQAAGTVKLDQGVVDYDTVQLSYCHITAPIAGRVGLRLVDPGNVVAANGNTVLAVITQLAPISVVFAISEDNLGQVLAQPNHGENLEVTVLDRVKQKQLATGRLITIDNQIDTTTGTVRLRALFDNKDEALFPNQFVNTKLLVDTVRGATALPSSAIQHDGADTFVYAIVGGKAHVQKVAIGVVSGDKTQITSGISPGAVVANSSFEKLRDGMPVRAAGSGDGSADGVGSAR